MITRQRQTTIQAGVPTVGQSLSDCRTTRASLTCAPGIDLNKHTPSIFCFVRDHVQENSPCGIVNTLSKVASHHPLDIKFFSGNQAVYVNECAALFMKKVCALLTDVYVYSLQRLSRFAPSLGTFLAPCYAPLCHSQRAFRLPVVARIINLSSVAQSGEVRKANIDSDHVWTKRQRIGSYLTRKDGEPAARRSLNGKRPNYSNHLPVLFYLDVSNLRDAHLAAAWSFGSVVTKRQSVVTQGRSESRVARLLSVLSVLDATKERFKSSVYSLKRLLKTLGVDASNVFAYCANTWQLIYLIIKRDRLTFQLPRFTSLLESRVVQFTANCKMVIEGFDLTLRWVNSVAKGTDHV